MVLVCRYSNNDKVAMNVGFYYMANALGRLVGGCDLRLGGGTGVCERWESMSSMSKCTHLDTHTHNSRALAEKEIKVQASCMVIHADPRTHMPWLHILIHVHTCLHMSAPRKA